MVETTQTASSDEMGQGLADGRWDVGIPVMDNVIAWNASFGADVQIIAQLERHTELRFVCATTDHSMRDVARGPIAVDATNNGFVLALYRALAREGIDWRACQFEQVGGVRHRFEALMARKARASILIPPLDVLAQANGYHTLWTREEMAPCYPGMVVAARRRWIEDARDVAIGYLRALLRAQAWAVDSVNREAAITTLTRAQRTPQVANQLITDHVKGLFPAIEGWKETLDLRRECGLSVEPEPRQEEVFNLCPLSDAHTSLDERTKVS